MPGMFTMPAVEALQTITPSGSSTHGGELPGITGGIRSTGCSVVVDVAGVVFSTNNDVRSDRGSEGYRYV